MGLVDDKFIMTNAKKNFKVDSHGKKLNTSVASVSQPQLGAIGILRMRISEKKLQDAEKQIVTCREAIK
jgi:hypothetical protein